MTRSLTSDSIALASGDSVSSILFWSLSTLAELPEWALLVRELAETAKKGTCSKGVYLGSLKSPFCAEWPTLLLRIEAWEVASWER